ncbi:MAG: acyl-CoA thioester hydrolase YciA [Proteobacteria bacterium]|nr:acyl-CoA thioester hydrolase YciA [Pseudomonadota bacterium]
MPNETSPNGELVIKTIAMPADTNRYGDMFGGWLVSQMDLGGAVLAHKCGHGRMTTVAIDRMTFILPVYVGDVVSCYATIVKRGRTSVGIGVEVWVERLADQSLLKVTEGLFTYVAIDQHGRPTAIQWSL